MSLVLVDALKQEVIYDRKLKRLVKEQQTDYPEIAAKVALQAQATAKYPGHWYEFNTYQSPVGRHRKKTVVCEIYKEEL